MDSRIVEPELLLEFIERMEKIEQQGNIKVEGFLERYLIRD